ncbi:uncharacterized protein [Physcomitrium patens]|uniref:Tify domain-containing protein n=1 Tax=Physcomitrium patens TaxID=3218 RepID=A0A7I4FAM8_PHYPA|nr:uncharacterized protein LOC112272790 isoform X2 [Physcomitrium patens]|eukprot:XP_024356672.1 uncharacterized protein LOC112272790 isoform X2 [Physcomitrella patens]
MNLVMADKDQPVFRDFLGLDRIDDINQVKYLSSEMIPASRISSGFESEGDGETNNTRASSGTSGRFKSNSTPIHVLPPFYSTVPSSSDLGSVGWQRAQAVPLQYHGNNSAFSKLKADTNKLSRKRDSPTNRDSLQERLVEALESSRPQKAPRHEHIRQEKIVETSEASGDDLRLSMQPPRASSRSPPWLQQSTKPEASQRPVKKHQPYRPSQINTGVGMRGISHLGACAERAERTDRTLVVPPRENNVAGSSQLDQPAADEGSRTGLKHSVLAGLLDNAGLLHHDRTAPYPAGSSGCPPLAPQHQKSQNQNGGSESMIPLSRQAPSTSSRQLTIFYGGQAHVFDDVPPDKADAILTLAGSNGRSWSTTCSPRPAAKPTTSMSEGSMSAIEREKEHSVQSLGGSLTLSSEVQTVLRGLKQSGSLTGRSA